MRYSKIILLIGIIILSFSLCGCSDNSELLGGDSYTNTNNNSPIATVVVTTDFGMAVVLQEEITIKEDTTALEALQQVAEVETKYGGGFVDAINGIESYYELSNGEKKDWFFYINGISVKTGAGGYILKDGDVEHWDFRDWSFHQFVPALIGDFPEPFVHGYGGVVRPTVVVYQDGWEESANRIADRLKEFRIKEVSCRNVKELPEDEQESCNIILVGTGDCILIEEINQIWERFGFYVHLNGSILEIYYGSGELADEYDTGVGVIQATQNPWNPKGIGACENVVWVVSGTDRSGVEAAADAMIDGYNDIMYACAILVVDREIIKVPR